ncbi:MAG TPA: BON domain-containing protein [Vicinamibacterales bacterium]
MILAAATACATHVSQAVDDATLAANVRTAILNDPTIGSQRIDVAVHAGVVTLSGTVSSPADQQRAVELARGVSGVVDVKSTLQTSGQATQASVRIRSGATPSAIRAVGISWTRV